jgi:hypothetical protein
MVECLHQDCTRTSVLYSTNLGSEVMGRGKLVATGTIAGSTVDKQVVYLVYPARTRDPAQHEESPTSPYGSGTYIVYYSSTVDVQYDVQCTHEGEK